MLLLLNILGFLLILGILVWWTLMFGRATWEGFVTGRTAIYGGRLVSRRKQPISFWAQQSFNLLLLCGGFWFYGGGVWHGLLRLLSGELVR